ncbi:MAG: NGG1p interacting factor NIF3 [Coriobacteriia bacterium]|nr:NGG1p interacting factor NIF3 [Coriobacteriia bacterium]MCL2870921.1 NGG1p interacting factor NIF3 [Coriobacteriia bacterium]
MKLGELFDLAIKRGIEHDPRGKKAVDRVLRLAKEEFEALDDDKKKEFDQDKLQNPYTDSKILTGDLDRKIKGLIIGVDMEVGEVLLADRLREKGEDIDLIWSHHPEGKALGGLAELMKMQEDLLSDLGLPISAAEGLMAKRISEVDRSIWPVNHNRAVDAAELLDFAMLSVHTPTDNMVATFLQKLMDKKKPETLGDIVKELKEIPEYARQIENNAGPKILLGSDKMRAGKIVVDMTGGTSGSEDVYERLSREGVSTIICMHIPESHRKNCEKNNINVIIAGHIASDAVGMNLLMDEIEAKGVKVYCCSGFYRHKRN